MERNLRRDLTKIRPERFGFRTALVAVTIAMVAILVGPIVRPTAGFLDCGGYVYQSGTASLQTAFGLVQYMHVDMWVLEAPSGNTCVDNAHMMMMYTVGPSHWTVNTGTGDSIVDLKISLPSWSTYSAVGSWSQVSGCSVYVYGDSGTGAGYSTAGWNANIYWPCPSGTVSNNGPSTYPWSSSSGHYGTNYPITFVMQDNPPWGITRTTTLTMRA